MANTRQVHIKIDLLDFLTEKKIGELEGICTDGAIHVTADSSYRRTASVTLTVQKHNYPVGQDKKVWIDKKIKILIGLKSIITGEIIWFNQGHFILNSPTVSYAPTDSSLSFEALDYMSMLDGTFSGSLQYITTLNVNTNISTAFRTTANKIAAVKKMNIESTTRTLPYTITKDATETTYDLLKEIAELYMDWEFFFDVEGCLRFKTVKNKLKDPVVWDFDLTKKLLLSHSVQSNFDNVRNSVQIWGRTLDNGTQIKYAISNTNKNSPFNTSKIGTRTFTYSDDKLYTAAQAQARGQYELNKHSNLNELITISCVPVYSLSVNEIIYLNNSAMGLTGKYLTAEMTIPLCFDDTMEIQAYKIYE